ncbi:MAG: hypothetical protein KDB14_10800 [Planctomycetales bacterium]|nr:hypothetical protein [Planctomycetales bacterium]
MKLSICLLSLAALSQTLSLAALAQSPATPDSPTGSRPAPVVFTTAEDHRNMLEQLGITKLRRGPSGDPNSPNAANYDESKANPYPELPELLKLEGGDAVTTSEQWWKQRRPEIVEAFEREILGRVPAHVPDVKWEIVETRERAYGDVMSVEQHLVGTVDNSRCPEIEVRIDMSLTLPKEAARPAPVLMMFGRVPFGPQPPWLKGRRPNGPTSESRLLAAGWGFAKLNPGSVQDDSGGFRSFGRNPDPNQPKRGMGLTRGIIGLCNLGQPRRPEDWGSLRAWAWGASRGLDHLLTRKEVDGQRVGIEGVSRYGKAALVTMAFDQRFAMVLIGSSGEGGASLYRRNFGEAVETLASSGEYHWMAGNFLKYAAEESSFGSKTPADMPVDSHQLIALCAPRLTFISYGIPEKGDALWLDQHGSFMAAIAAQPAYRLLGAGDLGRSDDYLKERMPPVNEGLLNNELAWRQHDGGHTDAPNIEHFIRWAEQMFAKRH